MVNSASRLKKSMKTNHFLHEETVTNKNSKATFSNLTFNKVTHIYATAGSDANVDYDAMTAVSMTVTVTENSTGDLRSFR